MFVGGNLVSWKRKKQVVVPCSSVEFEYRVIAQVTFEFMWISYLIHQLGIKSFGFMLLWCNN